MIPSHRSVSPGGVVEGSEVTKQDPVSLDALLEDSPASRPEVCDPDLCGQVEEIEEERRVAEWVYIGTVRGVSALFSHMRAGKNGHIECAFRLTAGNIPDLKTAGGNMCGLRVMGPGNQASMIEADNGWASGLNGVALGAVWTGRSWMRAPALRPTGHETP